MRAAVYYNNNDVRIQDIPKPSINPGEILVRIMASGICGSDVLEWYRIKKAPIVLGHEIAGTIEEINGNTGKFKPGDRVVVSHHVPCNTCRYCLSGHHTVCHTLHTTNFDPGGFTEFVRVPAINVDRGVFLMPDGMSFENGSFCEPLSCVVRGQRHARLNPNQTLLVMGSGISGLLHILLAKARGIKNIIATDVSEFKLKKALEAGATSTIHAMSNVPELVMKANNGRPADMVIVCTGAIQAFQHALKSVDKAGTILCFATTNPDVQLSVPINEFWRNSITMTSSYANSPDDLREAMELIRSGTVNVKPLISHRLPLEETPNAFKLMTNPENSLKIIIEPHGHPADPPHRKG